ncbi:Uncharacterized protein PCOAH_00043750 [Plasmodium coatneyi]|uniref:CKK domain-containing protein n=1 Tax=Plasmodium coatneyi TaxID=208452 RepID=A0A1B1E4L9_9APIC|nr:Uncharacterized protein PCOAH_00043750 [Plasmodium coatneyi]ANQ09963.1 Uncharacterized protein PCOAH_00043750 [Plasmodium coatneyi]
MHEEDGHAEMLKNYVREGKKKIWHKSEKCRNIPYCVNYDVLLRNSKEEQYIDLNLEVNYNLEELLAYKENIKKCFHENSGLSKNNLRGNRGYHYDDGYGHGHGHICAAGGISPFCYDSGGGKKGACNKPDRAKKQLYRNSEYTDEGHTSDSSNSYCSNVTDSSAEYEKTNGMNFSQRITYDSTILEEKVNLFDTVLAPKGVKKNIKGGKNNSVCPPWAAISGDNTNIDDSYVRTELSYEDRECTQDGGTFPFHGRENSKGPFPSMNLHGHPLTNLKFHKKYSNPVSQKVEEEILQKYEKIIKIMKYLRRIKNKYPQIEATISILSNHIKNVTFNCEKMFNSRQEMNDFLKKIYIYQIYLLKKVVFKNPRDRRSGDSFKGSFEATSLEGAHLGSKDRPSFRDYSEIPEGINRDAHFMFQHLKENRPVNSTKGVPQENVDDEGWVNFSSVRKHKGRTRNHLSKEIQRMGDAKKEKEIDTSFTEESAENNMYKKGKGKNRSKYKSSGSFRGEEGTTQDDDPFLSEANSTYCFTNLYADDADKTSAYYDNLRHTYREALKKHMHKNGENFKSGKNKKQSRIKKEHILENDSLNHKNAYRRSENFTMSDEAYVLPENESVREETNKQPQGWGNKRDVPFNTQLVEYESKKGDCGQLYKCIPQDSANKNEYRGRSTLSDAFKNDYLNVLDVQKYGPKGGPPYEPSLNALNLARSKTPPWRSSSKGEMDTKNPAGKEKNNQKTLVLFYDINKELSAISNRDSVIHALKHALLNKPHNFNALQNFLFKINVELVEYKNFILLLTRNIKKPHLEALYGLNDFSVFEKVYGKKVAPRFLVSNKVKSFYKYDTFYRTFKELTNVRDFSGITDAVELI